MSGHETIADIVAEMRKVKGFPVPYAPSGHNGVWATDLIDFADRIEAAWRHEKAEAEADALAVGGIVGATAEKSSVGGNAAAMREALKGLDEEMTFCERNVELGIGFALEGLREHCRIVRQILNAALSAPARNCDKTYRNKYDIIGRYVFEKEPKIVTVEGFIDWFTAPAAERKGDGDGR